MASGVIRTTCPYCGVGCGLLAAADGTLSRETRTIPPTTAGCARRARRSATRSQPTADCCIRRSAAVMPAWDEALDRIAAAMTQTIAEHGPDSVALYVSGQFLTEDYYVANKLMKGFIGSANIDTNSRLCMASSVAGHVRAFGEDIVPGCYEDIEAADLVVLVGSNTAWCHPVLYQRLAAARESRGTKVVVIDPRRTATCDIADIHLAIRPGSDVAVFAGLLVHLAASGACDDGLDAGSRDGLCRGGRGCAEAAPSLADVAAIGGRARRRS